VASYYLTLTLINVGVTDASLQLTITGCLQVWNFACAIGAVSCIKRLGKRTLFLTSAAVMIVSFVLIMAPHSQRIDIVSLDVKYKTMNEIQTPDTICLLLNAACCQRGLEVAVRLVRVVLLMDDSLPVDKLLSADGLLSVNDSLPVDKLLSAGQLLMADNLVPVDILQMVENFLSLGNLLSVEHLLSASYLLSVDTLLLLLVDHFPSGDC
jgi:hypothetical protein